MENKEVKNTGFNPMGNTGPGPEGSESVENEVIEPIVNTIDLNQLMSDNEQLKAENAQLTEKVNQVLNKLDSIAAKPSTTKIVMPAQQPTKMTTEEEQKDFFDYVFNMGKYEKVAGVTQNNIRYPF